MTGREDDPPSRIILLTIDSLRTDVAASESFRRCRELLSADFTEFTNCFSHGGATPFAFPPLLGGGLVKGAGGLGGAHEPLAEVLPHEVKAGFSNNGHLSEYRGYSRGFDTFGDLAPPGSESMLDRLKRIDWLRSNRLAQAVYSGLAAVYRDSELSESSSAFPIPYRTAPTVTDFFISSLGQSRSTLVWGHYMDPHTPFHPNTVGEEDFSGIDHGRVKEISDHFTTSDAKQLSEEELDLMRDLYRANVEYLNRHLSRFLEWCRERSWYDDALIVVTADHGELFGEEGRTFHPWDGEPLDELVEVPLFVRYPDGYAAGESRPHQVDHISVYRTIRGIGTRQTRPGQDCLQDIERRVTVSLSNTVKRATTPEGSIFAHRSGAKRRTGAVGQDVERTLSDIEYPNCATHSGKVAGVEEAERNRRLRDLGYR